MGRRELVRSLAGLCLVTACGPRSSSRGETAGAKPVVLLPPPAPRLSGPVEVWSWFDLPDDPRSRELSGIAWDASARTLWGVQDETANIVPIIPDRDFKTWGFGPVVTIKADFPLDLEGIVVTPTGFLVASEKGPRVLEVDRAGKLRRDVPLPAHFKQARDNKSLESLTLSPDGLWIFTTTEEALIPDGAQATTHVGTLVRVLRMPRSGDGENAEHAYATDPMPAEAGDYGIADLCALSRDELLVLERGWSRGYGNTARIYRASLADDRSSCLATKTLTGDVPVLAKSLLVDLAKVKATGLPPAKQKQQSALLDNYEGLALGPLLPDGRQLLFVISDDNARSDQFARIVVLAVG